jgi:hypothetical protein
MYLGLVSTAYADAALTKPKAYAELTKPKAYAALTKPKPDIPGVTALAEQLYLGRYVR